MKSRIVSAGNGLPWYFADAFATVRFRRAEEKPATNRPPVQRDAFQKLHCFAVNALTEVVLGVSGTMRCAKWALTVPPHGGPRPHRDSSVRHRPLWRCQFVCAATAASGHLSIGCRIATPAGTRHQVERKHFPLPDPVRRWRDIGLWGVDDQCWCGSSSSDPWIAN